MKQTFFSKYGAYIIAAILFVVLACIYCAPSLKGKVINAGDVTSYECIVHELNEYHEETGESSYWLGSMFCGMPAYQIGGVHYKSSAWLKPFRVILERGNSGAGAPFILLLYFVCFYVLLRCFDVDRWISIAGAIAIALSSYFIVIIPAGHLTKTFTIPMMAVALGGFKLIFSKRYALGFSLAAMSIALSFVRHPQMAYYIFMFIGILYIAELWIHIREKRIRDFVLGTGIFAGAVLLGLGANVSNMFANKEYISETMRGGQSDLQKSNDAGNKTSGLDLDYATQWSYGIDESLSFLIPGIKGGASAVNVGSDSGLYKTLVKNGVDKRTSEQFCKSIPLYWGEQPFTSGNVYMGAVVCFLFVFGLIVVRGPYKWAILAATVFSIMLSWGHNFMSLTSFFFNYFPMYSKFRAVSSILIVTEIAMPLLGFIAIRDVINGKVSKDKAVRSIYIAGGITAGICLLTAVLCGSVSNFTSPNDAALADLPDFVMKGIIGERKSLVISDSLRSFVFIAIAAALLWLYAKDKLKATYLATALIILVTVDMWPVDRRYFNYDNYVSARQNAGVFEMQPYEQQILTDTDPHFRVLNLTADYFNDARTSYYLKSIGGYSAVKLRRYQDLYDRHISQMNMKVIGMLNAKYIVMEGDNGQPTPFRNRDAMGNAWFVDTLKVVGSADDECNALYDTDLHSTAIVGSDFAEFAKNPTRVHDEDATVRLTKYTPRYIDYESSSMADGTVVFSEIYYPYGWKAYIDGTPAEHFRVNYALRALNIPAGQHKIHFEFAPDSVRKGGAISVACICTLYALMTAFIIMGILRRRKGSEVRP